MSRYLIQLGDLIRRGRDILRNEGFAELISRSWLFLHKPFFYYVSYYVYENNPEALPEIMKPEGLSVKVIQDNGLVRHDAYLYGSLAGGVSVGLNEKAKKRIDGVPVQVDFGGGQVWLGNARTFLRYRKKGIYAYIHYRVFREYPRARWIISKGNLTPQRLQARLGSAIVEEGRYLRLLCWEFT
jgi:hypothetical protein